MRARILRFGLAAGVAAALAAAAPALAGWSSPVDAGSLSVSTASLAAPTGVAAANAACTPGQRTSLTVTVTWTATSSPAAGYTILRATRANGPYTAVGSVVGVATTAWSDTTGQLRFTTTYYYVVESTVQSWTSPNSTRASVTTPRSKNCA